MNSTILKKTGLLTVFCIALMSVTLAAPMTGYGDEYPLDSYFSPNIINIASARIGEIRVHNTTSYSNFITNGDSVSIFFNDGVETIPNIQLDSDSHGHLILRFTLGDLLVVAEDLIADDYNSAAVVLVMNNGDEYIGFDDDVYIVDKIAP